MFGTRGWGLPRLQVGAKAMGTDKTMTKEHRQEQLAEEGRQGSYKANCGSGRNLGSGRKLTRSVIWNRL